MTTLGIANAQGVIATKRACAKDHPDVIQRFMDALIESSVTEILLREYAASRHYCPGFASLSSSGSRCFHHFASTGVPWPLVCGDAGIS